MSKSSNHILSIQDIRKKFGGMLILDGVNMELEKGKLYQLIGPNGSGKTTLINIVSGFFKPDGGKITFDGIDITSKNLYHTYKTGLVRTWQIPQPFVNLTTLENFLISSNANSGESFLLAPLKSKWEKDEGKVMDTASEIMEMVNLVKQKYTSSQNLSGGQQKLLELGRAMMSGAKMILMDEPIAGVNPTLAHEIFKKISQICKEQKITFLIVEHRLDIALQYADYVFAMNRGEIIAQGNSEQVIKHPQVIESYLGE
ncbi:ABC transporter ATP-binding protein [Nitrosopumilus sp.]|uniref:ABC transporter ATP-binding protein n=1 Tax=Nitrosopumilus sp. TaxID=2024843 RepID=UPI00292EB0E2|nr:ABC transporter ATP-binding protein [Nitrosopumilus sp.]